MTTKTISAPKPTVRNRVKNIFTITDIRPSPNELRTAMLINMITGCGAVVWFAVCIPQQLLNVFFTNHLGASSTQLGILVSIMQITAIFQLASIFIFNKLKMRKLFWVLCHVPHRLYGFSLAFLSLYIAHNGNKDLAIHAIILGLAVSWTLTMISSTGWWTWQTDLYHEKIRATFFGRRSAVLAGVGMIWFFTVTVLLDIGSKSNIFYMYAIIFFIASILGTADVIFHCLIPEPRSRQRQSHVSLGDFFSPFQDKNFIRYAFAIGLWTFSFNIAFPFFAPYITSPKNLGAPNTWLGIMYAITQTCWIISVPFWGKLMDRWGRKPIVGLCSLYPATWVLLIIATPENYFVILPLIASFQGLFSSGFLEGVTQCMLTITPEKNKTPFIAWYSVLTGVISCGGALLGGKLNDLLATWHYTPWANFHFIGFHVVILTAICLCFIGTLLIKSVREPGCEAVRSVAKKILSWDLA